ncbi:S-adenosyl-l-methionine hydroxide adenosyltransferase family protein [Telmatospirillum sp. J64-1]|uniref:SAM hydrolase/SAM-dependent halogenase family protein n=1 Tax=Telmatospirillum sp. J64-1 TaxID=2502183 RepID=UPI00115DDCE3|nr:SAM-dependent chlorinase/fluorinase [Telmatospirillum sp. J64-1]
MIVTFTDFGLEGPYLGQVKAVLHMAAPGLPVVDLLADAPAFDPQAAAYLLPPYASVFPPGSIFLCVIDPGVGTERAPLMLRADGRWYVGPDNGLFEPLMRRSRQLSCWRITWRGERLSASFHGRDLFAPVAAALARGEAPETLGEAVEPPRRPDWPDDLARIVYVDRYGNALTGLRASSLAQGDQLGIGGHVLYRARTFGDVPAGQGFWYENSNGLAEIAVNGGRADQVLGAVLGAAVDLYAGYTP